MLDYHHKKTLASIRKFLKPILRVLKKKHDNKKILTEIMDNKYNSSIEDMQKVHHVESNDETFDNDANEALEKRLINEFRNCQEDEAICVYRSNERMHVLPVTPHQTYVPVHFAKTSSGTFFWTSISTAAATTTCSTQVAAQFDNTAFSMDRWAQA